MEYSPFQAQDTPSRTSCPKTNWLWQTDDRLCSLRAFSPELVSAIDNKVNLDIQESHQVSEQLCKRHERLGLHVWAMGRILLSLVSLQYVTYSWSQRRSNNIGTPPSCTSPGSYSPPAAWYPR